MSAQAHWEQVYQTKSPDDVSWYQVKPEHSLALIQRLQPDTSAHIIDVGAGASTLADYLLAAGYNAVDLLDISGAALDITRQRVGNAHTANINWTVGDITATDLRHHAYDVWHDRAVFHFLTDPSLRRRYVEQVQHALKPGGYVIMATFADDGPEQCSGLNVTRYTPQALHATFGEDFALLESAREPHITPWSTEQRFIYCAFRKQS